MAKVQEEASQLVYATSFLVPERLLGGKCDIEVVINLDAGTSTGILSMKQVLASGPAFSISLDSLKAISRHIKAIKEAASLLENILPGATDHQLNWECGGARMIVVQPNGKKARFTLTIGNYHEEGALSGVDAKQLDNAIKNIEEATIQVEKRIAEVMDKVKKKK